MATRKDSSVLLQIRSLMIVGTVGDLTDGQLLERFATGRGEAAELAFAALVQRHGPMVLRVCRGVLTDPHDTEDAFQATFLVLVKKASGLWVKDSLGAWLHQVALRTASSALKDELRRRRHERRAAELAAVSSGGEDGARQEMERLLHAEIDRLPERYRVPIVLCDLEGRSHEQAARHLGWPIGTVKSRLSRGRDRLRDRLCRRGLFPGLEPIAAALKLTGLDDPIPNALVQSTTAAAIRFAASRTITSVSVASLAQGVLNTMSMTRWVKIASVLLVAGATATGVCLISERAVSGIEPPTQKKAQTKAVSDVPVAEVKSGKFKVSVSELGSIEAARSMDVLCQVEGQTTIIAILPEGTRVKKGQLVCELDSAALRDRLVNQRISTQGAEASYQNARFDRENGEIALKEYQDGTYLLDRSTVVGEIKLAESALQKAKARLERTRRARQRLNDTRSQKEAPTSASEILAELDLENQLEATEQTLLREQASLEKAQGQLNLLDRYTKDRMIRDLVAKVEERKSVELAKERILRIEREKESRLEKQIVNCKLFAPGDGVVVHANDPNRNFGSTQPQIEEGATVRERQKIFSVPDLSKMQVNTKVHESQIDKIVPGMKARVRVHAFSGTELEGTVRDVAPLPDPTSFFSSDIKVYTTHVTIDNPLPGLRPGMSAGVEILVSERDSALRVPAKAVLHYDDKDHVAVKKPDGGFEWRDVTVGDSNDTEFEVKQGIEPGERVVLDPINLLSEEERLKAIPTSASKKEAAAERAREKASARASRNRALPSALIQKFRNVAPEDRARMKSASQEEREAILRKAGFTGAELRQLSEMGKQPRNPN